MKSIAIISSCNFVVSIFTYTLFSNTVLSTTKFYNVLYVDQYSKLDRDPLLRQTLVISSNSNVNKTNLTNLNIK